MRKYSFNKWQPYIIFSLFFILVSTGFAQEAGDAAEEVVASKSFIDVFLEGGITMWFLLAQSILVIAFTIEGFLKFRTAKLAPPAVVALLKDAMAAGNYQQALDVCNANPCFVSRVFSAGLQRIGLGKESAENALAEAANVQATSLKTNLNYLSVIGVTAPMFGLLGTVMGMIGAFETLGSSGVADMTSLAGNISEVLVTTAGGLVVAIPAFILYYVLRNIASTVILRADAEVSLLMEGIPYEQLAGMQFGGTQ